MSDVYDVIIVGGGPAGLSAAYYSCTDHEKKVLVLEKFEDAGDNGANPYGSSPGFSRQFHVCLAEDTFCELAIRTNTLWVRLNSEMGGNILRKTGSLRCGAEGKGKMDKIVANLEANNVFYKKDWNKCSLKKKFPFLDLENYEGKFEALYVPEYGGTIDVPALMTGFKEKLRSSNNATLIFNAPVTSIEYQFDIHIPGNIRVTAGKGDDARQYIGKKVILTAGMYVNDGLSKLRPSFTKRIHLEIDLWTSTYFKRKENGNESDWPVWYCYGINPSPCEEKHINYGYYGFPPEVSDPSFARVCPSFISGKEFVFYDNPPSLDNRPVDTSAVKLTKKFVGSFMPGVTKSLAKASTCLIGGAKLVKVKGDDDNLREDNLDYDYLDDNDLDVEDKGAGIVLDFVPGTQKKVVLFTGGRSMKFIPMVGKILADLAIDGETCKKNKKFIDLVKIERGVLKEAGCQQKSPPKFSLSQHVEKINNLWC